uniref:Uncharacterized protein n=2 Tax=Leersia perrieri TaxID=77586 RepID=A0A0D9VSN1_9ORYZ
MDSSSSSGEFPRSHARRAAASLAQIGRGRRREKGRGAGKGSRVLDLLLSKRDWWEGGGRVIVCVRVREREREREREGKGEREEKQADWEAVGASPSPRATHLRAAGRARLPLLIPPAELAWRRRPFSSSRKQRADLFSHQDTEHWLVVHGKAKMSVAKKEEVCSHRLGPRLDEPAVGVPIKKRPVLFSDRLVQSGIPPSLRPSSPATGIAVSAAEAGCSRDAFLNRSLSEETNAIAKGNGMFNPMDQNHAKRSFIQSLTEKRGLSLDGSSDIPSRIESETGIVAPVNETPSQKFLSLGLQAASCRNGNINYSSIVKEEKVDQGLSRFPSADFHKDVGATSESKSSSDSSFGRLPNLDLNVPLDPHDPAESLPTMQDCGNRLYHGTVQHQKAHVPLVTPVSTVNNGLRQNMDSTLNLSNAYGLPNKRKAADVTLDLQLKPPARPEIGINWKELAPVPGLSLSLSGKHADESENNAELNLSLSGKHIDDSENNAPNVTLRFEPAESVKKITKEVDIPGKDKAPAEEVVKPVPCNEIPHTTISSTVAGIEKMSSGRSVKKEPEEQSQQHIQNDVEKAQLLESQSTALASKCAEIEKSDSADQVPRKAALDLNFGIPNVATANVPLPTERLRDAIHIETMRADHEVKKSIKCEETTIAIPNSTTASVSRQRSPLMATKPLPLRDRDANRTGLCVSASQSSLPTEPPSCNPDVASVDCKPIIFHVNSSVAAEACSPMQRAEPVISNSWNRFALDGMSQGSAEMDCSEDDNIVSELPTTNKPLGGTIGNNKISEDGLSANLGTNLQKEHDTSTHQDSSFVTNKIGMQGVSDDKCMHVNDGVSSHSHQDGRQRGDMANEGSKNKQLLESDKNTPVDNNDNTIPVKTTGSSTVDLRRLSSSETSTSPKMNSYKDSGSFLEKGKAPQIKSEGCQSPLGKQAANCSEDNVKNAVVKSEHQTVSEEAAKVSELHPRDPVLGEDSHPDGASSSQPNNECGMVKSASEKSECDKSKPDSGRTTSVQNERDGQVDSPHWREMAYPYVNRNERWERFMQSEKEKNKGEYQGGRHAFDATNQRRSDHRYGGRGVGSRGHPRNFRGPRMNEPDVYFDDEPMTGRRRPFGDEQHLHRIPHRRHNQIHGNLMREMDIDGFSGRDGSDPRLMAHGHMEDLSDDMMEERYYAPHSHRHHPQGDHAFIHRNRSHSPGQRRVAPVHVHRRRSPEALRRSPPLIRTDRPSYLPHRRHTQSHGSPFDREHDDRVMQRNLRRCGMHEGAAGDSFEPHLHPAQLAELHAEAELTERRKFGERRTYLRSFDASLVGDDDDEMLTYGADGDMDFVEGGSGGPRELDGRFRSRGGGHRGRDDQEDDHRCRGHGWRDGSSNSSRAKRRRY